jgi:hypothetical protein
MNKIPDRELSTSSQINGICLKNFEQIDQVVGNKILEVYTKTSRGVWCSELGIENLDEKHFKILLKSKLSKSKNTLYNVYYNKDVVKM